MYLLTYLLKNVFNHAGHTQHISKIKWVDFQMGRVLLTNYLNSHPSLWVSGIVDILRLNW
jgi:hypothetical protein